MEVCVLANETLWESLARVNVCLSRAVAAADRGGGLPWRRADGSGCGRPEPSPSGRRAVGPRGVVPRPPCRRPARPSPLAAQLPCGTARLGLHAMPLHPHLPGHPHVQDPPGRYHGAGDRAEHRGKGKPGTRQRAQERHHGLNQCDRDDDDGAHRGRTHRIRHPPPGRGLLLPQGAPAGVHESVTLPALSRLSDSSAAARISPDTCPWRRTPSPHIVTHRSGGAFPGVGEFRPTAGAGRSLPVRCRRPLVTGVSPARRGTTRAGAAAPLLSNARADLRVGPPAVVGSRRLLTEHRPRAPGLT